MRAVILLLGLVALASCSQGQSSDHLDLGEWIEIEPYGPEFMLSGELILNSLTTTDDIPGEGDGIRMNEKATRIGAQFSLDTSLKIRNIPPCHMDFMKENNIKYLVARRAKPVRIEDGEQDYGRTLLITDVKVPGGMVYCPEVSGHKLTTVDPQSGKKVEEFFFEGDIWQALIGGRTVKGTWRESDDGRIKISPQGDEEQKMGLEPSYRKLVIEGDAVVFTGVDDPDAPREVTIEPISQEVLDRTQGGKIVIGSGL